MFWIEGVTRTSNGFALRTLHQDGTRDYETLCEISAPPVSGKITRTRIITNFQSWSACTAAPFWTFLGIDGFEPSSCHQVFMVIHKSKEYLVPASVLIAALMRPIKHLHQYLFRPHGLEQMSVPLLSVGKPSVGFSLPLHRIAGNRRLVNDGVLASYSWMHSFPSARAMWDSVYQSAQSGLLGMTLPCATVSAIVRSVAWNGMQLVTDLTITSIHAHDTPFDFATGHTPNIVFHDSHASALRSEPGAARALPSRDGVWSLSNEEWHLLEPKVVKCKRAKHDLRRIIDLILFKLGTGTTWHRLDFQELNFNIVVSTYQSMLRDGRWSALEQTLTITRALIVVRG